MDAIGAGDVTALPNQCGTFGPTLLAIADEPQIESQAAEPVPLLELIARRNPLGGDDVRAVLFVAAERKRLAV